MSNKQKILYIVTKSDLGGIQRYLLEITKGLPENVIPYFIMGSEGYLSEELRKMGINNEQIYFVPMTNNILDIFQHIKSNIKSLGIINKIKPNTIHCNATTGSIVGAVCGLLTRIRTIYTVHGWPFTDGIPKNKQKFYKILEFLICAVFKKLFAYLNMTDKLVLRLYQCIKTK